MILNLSILIFFNKNEFIISNYLLIIRWYHMVPLGGNGLKMSSYKLILSCKVKKIIQLKKAQVVNCSQAVMSKNNECHKWTGTLTNLNII